MYKRQVPAIVPALGALSCAALLIVRIAEGDWTAPLIAGGLVVAIVILYFVTGAGDEGRIEKFLASERDS